MAETRGEYPSHAYAPRPRAAPGDRRPAPPPTWSPGAPLSALGGDFLTAALDLLCRRDTLTRSEIGDHADVVAEVADALATVADRLATDLGTLDPADPAAADLARARDALHAGSGDARRGAATLWAEHIRTLRDRVEQARPVADASTGEVGSPPTPVA